MNETRDFFTRGSLVGRDSEMERLDELSDQNLVVVHGPPGVGKSRLVHEWGGQRKLEFVWVELSEARSENDVVAALSSALGTEAAQDREPAQALARLRRSLRSRDVTIVLDSCSPAVEILDVANRLAEVGRIFVISRARLGTAHTPALAVAPLGLEDGAQLFCLRAEELAHVRFQPDNPAVRSLVEGLDGLPFAIELAASRTDLISPDQMLDRLDQPFRILRSRKKDETVALERTLEWSWSLLDENEKRFLKMLSVLPGDFDLDLIEATVGGENTTHDPIDLLERLSQKHWLERLPRDGTHAPRFRLLNTVRAFARTRADRSTPREDAVAHLVETARERCRRVVSADGKTALAEIDRDRNNYLWCVDLLLADDDSRAFVLVEALRYAAFHLGPAFVYRPVFERACEVATRIKDSASVALCAEACARLDLRGNEPQAAMRWANEAVEAAARASMPGLEAECLCTLATILEGEDGQNSLEILRRSREKTTDPMTTGRIHERMGFISLRKGDIQGARQHFSEALEVVSRAGVGWLGGDAEAGLAYVFQTEGKIPRAIDAFERAAEMRDFGRPSDARAGTLYNLAVALNIAGQNERSLEALARAERQWAKLGSTHLAYMVELRRAFIDLETGEIERARDLAIQVESAARRLGDQRHTLIASALFQLGTFGTSDELDSQELLSLFTHLHQTGERVCAAATLVILLVTRACAGESVDEPLDLYDRLHESLVEGYVFETDLISRLGTIAQGFLAWVEATASFDGHHRQTMLARSSARLRQAAGASPDRDDITILDQLYSPYLRILARELAHRLRHAGVDPFAFSDSEMHVLEVHSNCHWYRVDGRDAVDLAARKPTRLLLKTILQTHLDDPKASKTVEDLIAAGWPGESMTFESGRNRVYAAIRYLREHDLDGLIETADEGYRIAEGVDVRVAPTTGLQVR